jgi:hypothetical protein
MSTKTVKTHRSRKPYTTETKQAQVIERHLNGESNRKIAQAERIDRETVSRILTQEELLRMKAQLQSRLLRMGDRALDVCQNALSSKDERLRVAAAKTILEGVGVLDKRGLQRTIDDSVDRTIQQGPKVLSEFGEVAGTQPYGKRWSR